MRAAMLRGFGLSLALAIGGTALAEPTPDGREIGWGLPRDAASGRTAQAGLDVGREALMRGDFDAALVAAGEVAASAPVSDKRTQSAALLLRGEALLRRGALDDAEPALDAALACLAETAHTDLLVRILVATAELQKLQGRMTEARESFDEAERWARTLGPGESSPRDESERLLAEGRLFAFEARGDEALERFSRAAQACKLLEGRAMNRDANPSAPWASQASSVGAELDKLRAACVARVDAEAAGTRLRLGDVQRARRDLTAALAPLQAAGWELERARALGTLARAHLALGDSALAALVAAEASAITGRVGSLGDRADLRRLEAEVSVARGDKELARRQVEESRSAYTKLRSPRGIEASRLLLGRMAVEDRRIEEARIHLGEAARLARELDDADGLVESSVLLAAVARSEAKGEEERRYLEAALDEGPEPRMAARVGMRLGALLAGRGDGIGARKALEAAAEAAERIPLFRVAPRERDLAQRERQAIYDALLQSQLATGASRGPPPLRSTAGVYAALMTAERSAARGLSDLLERSRALRPEAERAMRALDGLEREERSLAAAALGGDEEARRGLGRLARKRETLEAEALGLSSSALTRGSGDDGGRRGSRLRAGGDQADPAGRVDRVEGALERIAAALSPDVALLKFHLADEGSHLFVLTRDGVAEIAHFDLPGRVVIAGAVQRYLKALGTAPDQRTAAERRALVEDGRALFATLVEPALGVVGPRKRVVFVPHRELRMLAFDALPFPAAHGGGWLGERLVTSTAPSLAALVTLEQSLADKAARPRHAIAAFGDPVYTQMASLRLPRLEATVAEVKLASQLVQRSTNNPDAGAVFLGQDATEARLKALALSRYRVLHLATHGFAPDQMDALGSASDGMAPGDAFRQPLLVLGAGGSEDGLLTIDEVLGLNLDADLVVLSACSSGRGALEPGDGLGGLVNAFLYAGSAGVLATLWPIEDRHAAAMMETFYRELGRGESAARALSVARAGAIAKAPGTTHARGVRAEYRGMGGITGAEAPRSVRTGRVGVGKVDPFFWAAWVLSGAVGDLFE